MPNSKTLYIVRHAESNWAQSGQRDFDRPLNERGLRDASFTGKRIKNSASLPDLIVCSPALRAKQTYAGLDLNIEPTIFDPNIYEASSQTLLQIIQAQNNQYNRLMLIGHNPSITWLIELLCDTQIGDLAPCSVVELKLNTSSWENATNNTGTLINIAIPALEE